MAATWSAKATARREHHHARPLPNSRRMCTPHLKRQSLAGVEHEVTIFRAGGRIFGFLDFPIALLLAVSKSRVVKKAYRKASRNNKATPGVYQKFHMSTEREMRGADHRTGDSGALALTVTLTVQPSGEEIRSSVPGVRSPYRPVAVPRGPCGSGRSLTRRSPARHKLRSTSTMFTRSHVLSIYVLLARSHLVR